MSRATHPTRFASATKPARRRSARRSRSADRRFNRRYQYRPLVEALEDRRMLTLAGLFDPTPPLAEDGTNWGPAAPDSSGSAVSFVPGEILIGFERHLAALYRTRGSTAALELTGGLLEPFGLRDPDLVVTASATTEPTPRVATRWQLAADADVLETAQRLAETAGIAYAEPNYLVSVDSIPNDPRFDDLWGLHNTGQSGGTVDADIDAPAAWELTVGSTSTVVGVIDSGIDYTHPDLLYNIWINQLEIPASLRSQLTDVDGDGVITFRDLNHASNADHVRDLNGNGLIDPFDLLNDARWATGTDTDGNGYVDDLFGWDFYNNDNDPFDDHGHGTHCAGTIGAVGNNGIGVVGVNWNVLIMGLKFLSPGGWGSMLAAAEAVSYATAMANRGENIKLTSNSWGVGYYSQTLYDAIAASGAADMLFVTSAGNNAGDTDESPHYPSSYDLDNVISVAATDRNDALSSFSNFGANSVDLGAPGSAIVSTTVGGNYGSMSGTSMAAPHVAGVAALAWSYAPQAPYQQIRDAMFEGVDPLDALQGITVTGGRLNARNTLDAFADDPGDTLETARVTRLVSPAIGDYRIVSSAEIGDGAFGDMDVDMYRLSGIPGSGLMAITSQPLGEEPMGTVLRLFDANGNELAIHNPTGGYARLDYTFSDAGTYYVGVSGEGNAAYDPTTGGSGIAGDTGKYRLELGFDVGDTLATAAPTGITDLGDRFQHPNMRLGDGPFAAQDVDMHKFTARADSRLTATTSQPWGEDAMQTVLRLFDAAGSQLAIADPSGYARLDHTFDESGTYYLGVSGAGNATYDPAVGGSGTEGNTGHYRLELSLDIAVDFAVYVGGTGIDYAMAVAVDEDGNSFVTGYTKSDDLPNPTPLYHYQGDDLYDAFVAKIDSDGDVVWTTYLGGTGSDYSRAITIDGWGNLFVTGHTNSEDFTGALNSFHGGTWDAFVAKINGETGAIDWTTYLGGSGTDYIRGIALDSGGNLFVTGYTNSEGSEGLPEATNEYHGGTWDAFVGRIDGETGTIDWTTYLGGSGSDLAAVYAAIAIDGHDNVFVTGYTDSEDLADAINVYQGGTRDAFVAKIDGAGKVDWTMYLGGSDSDFARGIAVDANNHVLVTGYTRSDDLPSATNGRPGGTDGFVAKISGEGAVQWTTYLGGSSTDYGNAIATNGLNDVFVTGLSFSADFEWATNAARGGADATLIKLDGSTGGVAWMVYLGGSANDYGYGIATDGHNRVYVTGLTYSTDFTGASNTFHGERDGFLVKVDPASIPSPPASPADDTYTVMSGTMLVVDAASGVLANDLAPAGVDPTQLSVELVSGPIRGQVQLASDGSFIYTPPHHFLGDDSFWYRVFDGDRYSKNACVTIDVQGVTYHSTDTPKTIRDAGLMRPRKTESVRTISGTDTEVGALVLEVSITHSWPTDLSAYLVSPAGTRVQLFEWVAVIPTTYDLSQDYFGESLDGNWTLEIWDHWIAETGTLNAWSLTVAPLVENSPPVASDDSYSVDWNTTLTVPAPGVLSNDIDSDGDPLTAELQSGPSNGTLRLNSNGSFTYTPDADYHGTDSFTYQANDGLASSNVATVTILVVAPNLPPEAADDSYTVSWNQTLDVAAPGVLANDSDPNGDALTAELVEGPSRGSLVPDEEDGPLLNPDGSFTYVPETDFVGMVTFTYKAYDGEFFSEPATVTISVINHVPVADDDYYSTDMNVAITVDAPGVLGNDWDEDGDELVAMFVGGPENGTLVPNEEGGLLLNPDGSFTYAPNEGFHGTDSFTYQAYDGHRYSNPATVTITVIDLGGPVEPGEPLEYTSDDTPMTIEQAHPRQGARDTISTITIAGSEVTHIGSYGQFAIVLDIDHPRPGDLSAQLVSPADNSVDFVKGQVPINTPWETNAFDNEALDGTWRLVIQDHGRGGTGTLISWSITVTPVTGWEPLTLCGDSAVRASSPVTPLSDDELQLVGASAAALWVNHLGLPAAPRFDLQVRDLPTGQLGLARGRTIAIDADASGVGWFVDAQPYGRHWPGEAASALATRVDLLTVVAHEIGHLLGYGHSLDVHSLMAETLPVGTRRLPDGESWSWRVDRAALPLEIEIDALTPSRAQASDVFDGVDLLTDATARPAELLQVGFADHTPARAVDRLMAVLGRGWARKIEPLEDVLEELTEAES